MYTSKDWQPLNICTKIIKKLGKFKETPDMETLVNYEYSY